MKVESQVASQGWDKFEEQLELQVVKTICFLPWNQVQEAVWVQVDCDHIPLILQHVRNF